MINSYLLNGVKVTFHAFDGDILASLDGLSLKHLGEGTLTLLGDQTIFYRENKRLEFEKGKYYAFY